MELILSLNKIYQQQIQIRNSKKIKFFSKIKNKVKFTQPQFGAMGGTHLMFLSHEPAYNMTYDCWLDTR